MNMRAEILVNGMVQGVGYRKNTKRRARKLNLTGRVWNNQDGTVQIIAQGTKDNLQQLLEWSRKGQYGALVTNVDSKYSEIGEVYDDFLVLRFK